MGPSSLPWRPQDYTGLSNSKSRQARDHGEAPFTSEPPGPEVTLLCPLKFHSENDPLGQTQAGAEEWGPGWGPLSTCPSLWNPCGQPSLSAVFLFSCFFKLK